MQIVAKAKPVPWGMRTFPRPARSRPEDLIATINAEIGLLTGWAEQEPETADVLGTLVDGWKQLARRTRAKLN